ncbi:DNA polymerase [Cupriavidus sp. RAF12]|uniref:DNA polymerase n=1 Tax=Cupriavidus sp. RAF12 TaxID=3233050 RepID=UPI003F9135F5
MTATTAAERSAILHPAEYPKILVDARNFDTVAPQILAEMATAKMVGFDIETDDENRHDGLNKLMKVNAEGKKGGNTKLLFDTERTSVDGFSLHVDGTTHAYYINLHHADVENRLPWEKARTLLEAKPEGAYWVIHNKAFEIVMMLKSLGFDLGEQILCSLQLCVSAYSPDTYPMDRFTAPGLGGISKLVPQIAKVFAGYQAGQELTAEQDDLLMKVIAKESDAEHSYNGYVKSISYGYDLKKAVKSWFGYEMQTFDQTLNGKAHMGQLTGDEVVSYGADDAIWCVKLFHRVLEYIMSTNPPVFQTYLDQELPAVREFAEAWAHGIRMDKAKVQARRDVERQNEAKLLRRMKAAVRRLLPFPAEPHDRLTRYDTKWYPNNYAKYRSQITTWANSLDCNSDDFTQCMQVRGPVSNAWAADLGKPESKGVNLTHYMPMRTMLYDLCGVGFILSDGKVQSDGDARALMRERWIVNFEKEYPGVVDADKASKTFGELREQPAQLGDVVALERYQAVLEVLDCYSDMAELATRMKLFVTPYMHLVDPETGKVYPQMSSLLATRRSACSNPNGQQLGKYGESAYVRGFFEADEDDHVLVSADWSAVELVGVGEESKDENFFLAYGQRPHQDLHSITVCGLLGITKAVLDTMPDKKELRTRIGKPANFGYWYSGGLGTTAKELGWSSEEMWEYVDKYRGTYSQAEQWRLDTIQFAREHGYVELRDHHRRDRFEATYAWANIMRQKAAIYGLDQVNAFFEIVIKKIMNRAGNQSVNAKIQGLCAALAKRTMKALRAKIKAAGLRARFYLLVHDELVYSVHRDDALEFMDLLYETMIDGFGLITYLKLDSSLAVGRNFQPWSLDVPHGQIELMELNKKLPCVGEDRWGKSATREERQAIIDYLFSEQAA